MIGTVTAKCPACAIDNKFFIDSVELTDSNPGQLKIITRDGFLFLGMNTVRCFNCKRIYQIELFFENLGEVVHDSNGI